MKEETKQRVKEEIKSLSKKMGEKIIGAQYSALEDGDCPFCKALNGLTVNLRRKNGIELFDKYSPAQHQGCNCMWMYILSGEKFEDDNKNFEKKWEERFRKDNPELAYLSREEILIKYATSNFITREEYWIEEFCKERYNELLLTAGLTVHRDQKEQEKLEKPLESNCQWIINNTEDLDKQTKENKIAFALLIFLFLAIIALFVFLNLEFIKF